MVAVVQLVRASDCGSECRGFESHLPPNERVKHYKDVSLFFCLYHNKTQKRAFSFAMSSNCRNFAKNAR